MPTVVRGEFVNGSALTFKEKEGTIVAGLAFEDLTDRWFDGYEAFDFFDGIAVLFHYAKGTFGAINRRGEFILDPHYEALTNFSESRAFAIDGSTVLMDEKGVTLKRFDSTYLADEFHDGYAVLSEPLIESEHREGVYGLVDRSGNFVFPPNLHRTGEEEWFHIDDSRFSDGLLRVIDNGRCRYIDSRGETVIGPEFESGTRFSGGMAGVRLNGKWGFVDKKGTVILPCEWDDVQTFAEGLASVCKSGTWGVIDRKGRIVLPCEFREISQFKDGHASARTDFGCGLIDRFGNFIVPPIYDLVYQFHEGIARVYHRGEAGIIDKSLNVVWRKV